MAPPLTTHQAGLRDTALTTGYGLWAGLEVAEWAPARAVVAFRPRPEMLTPWGTLNGGVVSSLVEVPSFLALLHTVEDGELPVTNDIFVQHLRPLPGDARYMLTGTLLRRSRTMAWTDVVVEVDGAALTLARITKTMRKA
ncbi:PaaI family thioesterase [Sphingomonas jatrophae]|uniref:Uncharacterized domain 1-containing protein n=1 Tax=Sphingomonas jatrophae TaxID=1166337 RepID=A0A1I6KG40_9SPHN|nr:PaaI family thioesterase [Sphingomonas jatrophae]SFR90183.1 uncharacterized domain 1-containing protein [Sphingomonas jatrophae]